MVMVYWMGTSELFRLFFFLVSESLLELFVVLSTSSVTVDSNLWFWESCELLGVYVIGRSSSLFGVSPFELLMSSL